MVLYIINCSKEKAQTSCSAKDMYKSKRFIQNLHNTEKPNTCCLIFSGKYGLIDPSVQIAPYDLNLNYTSLKYQQELATLIEQKLRCKLNQNVISEIHTDSKDIYYDLIEKSLIKINYSGKIKTI